MEPTGDYENYRDIFKNERMPFAFIDLNKFDQNIDFVASTQKNTGKTVRVHSKSIRCAELTRRIFDKGGPTYKGIMNMTVEETAYLFDKGFNDFIIAYPSVQPSDLKKFAELTQQGVKASLMVDSEEHLKLISDVGEAAGVVLKVCLELDMAYRPLNSNKHIGMRRSPVRTPEQALEIAKASKKYKWVEIDAMMGYEGHIAGPQDDIPNKGINNKMIRGLKKRSIKDFSKRRIDVVKMLQDEGLNIEVINGGGSGSLVSTGKEPIVTEVTAGSAFYAPGSFWYYKEVSFNPSAFFAVQVVRKPTENMVTCQGGGYTASGPAGNDKLPVPVFPRGITLLSLEGAGEVQTPLQLPEDCPELELGDPVFFQHAKGGELCERFNHLYLVENNQIVEKVNTYRGDGFAFL
jgi:D-serine deaminase-like pyridoxal phosphate-dependent protein